MYKDIVSALKEASENDTAVTLITGNIFFLIYIIYTYVAFIFYVNFHLLFIFFIFFKQGQGDYYSSGNDLSNFSSVQGDISAAARNAAEMLR